jgi:hypothetical protein
LKFTHWRAIFSKGLIIFSNNFFFVLEFLKRDTINFPQFSLQRIFRYLKMHFRNHHFLLLKAKKSSTSLVVLLSIRWCAKTIFFLFCGKVERESWKKYHNMFITLTHSVWQIAVLRKKLFISLTLTLFSISKVTEEHHNSVAYSEAKIWKGIHIQTAFDISTLKFILMAGQSAFVLLKK